MHDEVNQSKRKAGYLWRTRPEFRRYFFSLVVDRRSRADNAFTKGSQTLGSLRAMALRSVREIRVTLQLSKAVAVAERGPPSIIPISPKTSFCGHFYLPVFNNKCVVTAVAFVKDNLSFFHVLSRCHGHSPPRVIMRLVIWICTRVVAKRWPTRNDYRHLCLKPLNSNISKFL